MKFDGYDFKDYIVKAINDLHFKQFSEVQREVFNNLTSQRNFIVKSKTGSGKTHAFLIPVFNSLEEKKNEVQALIVSPTTELAMQTYKVAQHIASFSNNEINIKVYTGGTDREREISNLNFRQPQIVIATPGKLKDLTIDTNALDIHTAKLYIIDEVDMTLASGFEEEMDQITDVLQNARMMFFSATINESMLPFIKKYMPNNKLIDIKNDNNLQIEHFWIPLKHKSRDERLLELVNIINPYLCIIFCNKKENVLHVAQFLRQNKISCIEIHGDLDKRNRRQVLREVESLKYQYIVASDLASRGIDIDGVSHIINYEIPRDFEFYLHRSGRTGRMNYTGIVYSFFDELDNEYLNNLANRGINPVYKDIKNGELVETKERESRKNRVRPINEKVKQAIKFVPKSDKVKPGYKKKRQEQIKKITKKLYQEESRKNFFRSKKHD